MSLYVMVSFDKYTCKIPMASFSLLAFISAVNDIDLPVSKGGLSTKRCVFIHPCTFLTSIYRYANDGTGHNAFALCCILSS